MNHSLRLWIAGAMLAMSALAVSACGPGTDEAKWTEEVKLHDGQMIKVWRRAKAYSSGFPNAKRGQDIEFELKYEPLGVHWRGTPYFEPFSFEIFDHVAYLVLYMRDRQYCSTKKSTDYAARILRWESGTWREISQDQFPINEALMNLYLGYWGHSTKDDAKGLVTWEKKAINDGSYPDKPDTVQQWFARRNWICAEFGK